MNCDHEYENANCTNCANGLPHSAYECAKTRGQLREYVRERADHINRQKYNEGYEQGYEQGRADAIDEYKELARRRLLQIECMEEAVEVIDEIAEQLKEKK